MRQELFLRRKLRISQKGEIVAKVYANGKISPELVTDFQKYVKIKMSDETLKMREIIEIISYLMKIRNEIK